MKIQFTTVVGPLTQALLDCAQWRGKDKYPAFQGYADEAERLLSFAKDHGVLERYMPDLCSTTERRDSALDELRIALLLESKGFQIVEWEPKGEGPKKGEYLVRCPSGSEVFVEAKGPGWEAEVPDADRASRLPQGKYVNGEGGGFDNTWAVQHAVDKAYSKFSTAQPNLLVIADDLFVSLEHGMEMWVDRGLYDPRHNGRFVDARYERLGGVAILTKDTDGDEASYEMSLFLNPFALPECALPPEIVQAFEGRVLDLA